MLSWLAGWLADTLGQYDLGSHVSSIKEVVGEQLSLWNKPILSFD